MSFAIIETGGKQYLVSPKDKIKVEKISPSGDEVNFDKVLLVADGSAVKVGQPHVTGAKVVGKILTQGRGRKIRIFKYKPKVRYRRHAGHRQEYTEIEIQSIA